jgi:hypothetical protein
MPVTSDLGGKNYTLGRGRVFFDRFAPNVSVTANTRGEGERYIGNTPEFSTTSAVESLDHYDSDSGVKTKDGSVQLSLDRTGAFTTDNISNENLALFFLGEISSMTQTSQTGVTETIANVRPDRFYQLGVSVATPSGVRSISNVVIKKNNASGADVTQSGNYEVDEITGRIYILSNAAGIAVDDDLFITYDIAASVRDRIISKNQSIYGSLRMVSDNPTGQNRDIYMPYVKLSPDGDYNLKGDDWQSMGFTVEILKKASNIEALYVDGRPA